MEEELTPVLLKLFQETERKETLTLSMKLAFHSF
jgi:hypothetical protein